MAAHQSSASRDPQVAPEVEIINFQLGEMEFACDLGQASSFALFQDIQGYSNFHVCDIFQSLKQNPLSLHPDTRVILFDRKDVTYVFPVSKINGIFKVPAEQIFAPPPILQEAISHPGLIGFALVNSQVVLLLDLEKIIAYLPNQTDDAGKN